MPHLENWSVVALSADPYTAPECIPQGLHGNVYGHPRFVDGVPITTSRIVTRDAAAQTATTKSGTFYSLGEIDPNYEAAYPGARERFFNQPKEAA